MLRQITLGKEESPKKFTVELKATYEDVKKDIDKIMCNQEYIKMQSATQTSMLILVMLIGLITGASFMLYYLTRVDVIVFNVITNDILTSVVQYQQYAITIVVIATVLLYSVVLRDEMEFERAAKLFSKRKKTTLDDDVNLYRRVLTAMNKISCDIEEKDVSIKTAPYRFLLSPRLEDVLGVSNNKGDFIYMEAGMLSSCHIPVENEGSGFLDIIHNNRVGIQVDYNEKLKLYAIEEVK